MTSPSGASFPQSSPRVAALVARLQALHSELADQPDEHRRRRLAALIEHDAAEMGPEQRASVLKSLSGLCSDVQSGLRAAAGAMVEEGGGLSGITDANALVARLAELAPKMTSAERAVAQRRLKDAGLATDAATAAERGLPAAQAKSLSANLQLGSNDELDAMRVLESTGMLVDFVSSLDQLVWNTWKAIAPDSGIKRGGPIKATIARFVAGDAEPGAAKTKQELERLRQVTAALTAAVGQAGRQFAQRHLQKFAPAEIERSAKDEGNWNLEVRCWKKYQELAAANDVEAMQLELMAAIAAYAEALLRGASGAGSSKSVVR